MLYIVGISPSGVLVADTDDGMVDKIPKAELEDICREGKLTVYGAVQRVSKGEILMQALKYPINGSRYDLECLLDEMRDTVHSDTIDRFGRLVDYIAQLQRGTMIKITGLGFGTLDLMRRTADSWAYSTKGWQVNRKTGSADHKKAARLMKEFYFGGDGGKVSFGTA